MTAGPATGAHLMSADAASRLDLSVGCGGVLVGTDGHMRPTPVQLFRPRPTQVALVTSGYVARLLAVRAMAVGACVHAASSRPQNWQPVVSAAPRGQATLVMPGSPLPDGSTATAPLLRCDDLGPSGGALRSDLAPWQTRVVVRDFLPASALHELRAFDLVIVQRIAAEVARPLRGLLDLPPELVEAFPGMPDDVVALLTHGRGLMVRLAPSRAETNLLGIPVRHDG